MSEFIAALLYVAIGDAYDARAPLSDAEFTAYHAAQSMLERALGWS
jgi:hypothetical protein